MKTFDVPAHRCPLCAREAKAATNMDTEDEPRVGDITLCVGCGEVLQFAQGMRLRPVTFEERDAWPRAFAAKINRMRSLWRRWQLIKAAASKGDA